MIQFALLSIVIVIVALCRTAITFLLINEISGQPIIDMSFYNYIMGSLLFIVIRSEIKIEFNKENM